MIRNVLKNKIFKNASWIIGCKILQAIIGLIVSMLTARYLGPSNYGIINYAASIVAFFTPIMQLGMTNIMVQEIVSNPKEEGTIIGTSLTMCLFSGFFCVLGVASFSCIANADDKETILVCILYSLSLVAQASEITQYWFQAKYLSKYTSIFSVVAYIVVAVYQIFLLFAGKSVYWFSVTYSIQYLLIAFSLLIKYHKVSEQKLSLSWQHAKRLFSKGKYYIVSSMMVTIFAQTDRIMLKMMDGNEATGFYSAAVTCAGLTSFVFMAIIDSVRPSIFESYQSDENKFEKNVSRLYCLIIYLSLAQSLFMTLFAKYIIHILYGNSYSPSILALQIIVWYTTFSYLGVVRNVWILAKNKQRYLWIINLLGALANVFLNLLFIPRLGIVGASIASLITQFFTNVIVGYIIKPIRENNKLMLCGLNPNLIIELIKKQ